MTERDPDVEGLLYDTTILLDRQGELVGRYRKSHLYPTEHAFFRRCSSWRACGSASRSASSTPFRRSSRRLRGAALVLNPSAVLAGFGHLQDLRTRARAQDNQIFVAAINHVGREGAVTYCGRSQVADPRGEVVAMAPDAAEAAIVAELDLGIIRQQRRQEPTFRALRPELYET